MARTYLTRHVRIISLNFSGYLAVYDYECKEFGFKIYIDRPSGSCELFRFTLWHLTVLTLMNF